VCVPGLVFDGETPVSWLVVQYLNDTLILFGNNEYYRQTQPYWSILLYNNTTVVSAISAIIRSNPKKMKAIMISTLLRITVRDRAWFYIKGEDLFVLELK
jgi:hypothetical protein